MTTSASDTVQVRVSGTGTRGFAQGVAMAKRLGGRYDGASRTWAIPAERVQDIQHGLLKVVSGCSSYTREQGCPMHGETCGPEYR